MEKRGERIDSLDSLRGIAALSVVVHHSLIMTPIFWMVFRQKEPLPDRAALNIFTFSPVHAVWSGQEAVILFFVLSGFVLSLPYYNKPSLEYPSFFVKRIFRIYLPYLCALGIGVLFNTLYNEHARIGNLSEWFNDIWERRASSAELVDFFLLRTGSFHNIVTSLWTIPIELKISLLFPFVAYILKRLNGVGCLLVLVANIAFYMGGKRLGFQDKFSDFSLFYYQTFFLAGAITSKSRKKLVLIFEKLSKPSFFLLLIVALLLYTFTWTIRILPEFLFKPLQGIPGDYMVCVAAVLFILLAISGDKAKWLNAKGLVKLGEISFSLYLLHPIVIGLVGFELGHIVPPAVTVILCILLSILMSVPFSRYVEIPLQKMGRRLSKKITTKTVLTGYAK